MMGTVTTIGLDIAKSVFQVHGVDAVGEVAVTGSRSSSRRHTWGESAKPEGNDARHDEHCRGRPPQRRCLAQGENRDHHGEQDGRFA